MLFNFLAWPYRLFLCLEDGDDSNQTEELSCQLTALKLEHNQCIGKIDEMEKVITGLTEQLDEKKALCDENQVKASISEETLNEQNLAHQIAELKEEMYNAHYELDLKQNQIETLTHQLNVLKSDHDQCAGNMTQMEKKFGEEQTLCSELQAENSALEKALNDQKLSYEHNIIELKEKVGKAHQELNEQSVTADKKLVDANNRIEALTAQLNIASNKYDTAQKLYEQTESQMVLKNSEHVNTVMEYNDKLLEKDEKLKSIQEQLNKKEIEHSNEISVLTKQNEDIMNEFQQFKALIERKGKEESVEMRSNSDEITNSSEDVKLNRKKLAELWNKKGQFCVNRKLYDSAVESFGSAVKYDSTNTGYHVSLGLVYLQMDDKNKAIYCAKKALHIDPNDKDAIDLLEKASTYA